MADTYTYFRNRQSPVTMLLSYDVDGDTHYIALDNVEDDRLSLNSTITEHPIINGDIVADHMYDNPATMTVDGDFDESVMSFVEIQQLFENLKSNGIPLKITKQKRNTEASAMFQTRDNMILRSISWQQRITTLHFSFTFHQIQLVDIQEQDYRPADDPNAPFTDELQTLSFTDMFVDINMIAAYVVNIFETSGLIGGPAFSDYFWSNCKYDQKYRINSFAEIVSDFGSDILLPFLSGNINLFGDNLNRMIENTIRTITNAFGKGSIKPFNLSLDSSNNQREVQRLTSIIDGVIEKCKQLNNKIKLFGLSENKPQSCYFIIGGEYCLFKFTTNNTGENGSEYVVNAVIDTGLNADTVIVSNRSLSTACKNVSDCLSGTALCTVGNESTWMLVKDAYTLDTSNLLSVAFLTTSLDMSKWTDELVKVIKEGLQ